MSQHLVCQSLQCGEASTGTGRAWGQSKGKEEGTGCNPALVVLAQSRPEGGELPALATCVPKRPGCEGIGTTMHGISRFVAIVAGLPGTFGTLSYAGACPKTGHLTSSIAHKRASDGTQPCAQAPFDQPLSCNGFGSNLRWVRSPCPEDSYFCTVVVSVHAAAMAVGTINAQAGRLVEHYIPVSQSPQSLRHLSLDACSSMSLLAQLLHLCADLPCLSCLSLSYWGVEMVEQRQQQQQQQRQQQVMSWQQTQQQQQQQGQGQGEHFSRPGQMRQQDEELRARAAGDVSLPGCATGGRSKRAAQLEVTGVDCLSERLLLLENTLRFALKNLSTIVTAVITTVKELRKRKRQPRRPVLGEGHGRGSRCNQVQSRIGRVVKADKGGVLKAIESRRTVSEHTRIPSHQHQSGKSFILDCSRVPNADLA
eukprot:1157906-Pelagomonas_calceolata.AAC.5